MFLVQKNNTKNNFYSARKLHTLHNQDLQNRPQGRFFVGIVISTKSSKVEFKKAAKNHYF